MKSAAVALTEWFGGFGIPVYLDGDVPDEAEAPYMTIPLRVPEWDRQASFLVKVWYRTTSNLALITKADEIVAAVNRGVKIKHDNGYIALYTDTPLQYEILDGDYKGICINLIINAYNMPGV